MPYKTHQLSSMLSISANRERALHWSDFSLKPDCNVYNVLVRVLASAELTFHHQIFGALTGWIALNQFEIVRLPNIVHIPEALCTQCYSVVFIQSPYLGPLVDHLSNLHGQAIGSSYHYRVWCQTRGEFLIRRSQTVTHRSSKNVALKWSLISLCQSVLN